MRRISQCPLCSLLFHAKCLTQRPKLRQGVSERSLCSFQSLPLPRHLTESGYGRTCCSWLAGWLIELTPCARFRTGEEVHKCTIKVSQQPVNWLSPSRPLSPLGSSLQQIIDSFPTVLRPDLGAPSLLHHCHQSKSIFHANFPFLAQSSAQVA